MKKKKTVLLVVAISVLVIGIGVLLYPTVSQFFNQLHANDEIEKFKQSIITPVEDETKSSDSNNNDNDEKEDENQNQENSNDVEFHYTKEQLDNIYKDMQAYNEKIYENGQSGIADPFSFQQNSLNFTGYTIYNNLLGYIEAPTIGMSLPIYLGATEYNMSLGAAYLSNTSLPIGGKNTNAVFAGHTAYIGRTLFDNTVNLQIGDPVYITNFWETLDYVVVDTKVILPNETENILIQDDRDLVTFTTCYPYGRNTHRFLVVCERIEENPTEEVTNPSSN